MIELFEVSAGYNGQNVLNNVTLDFKKGAVTVLLGPNGCGKSTLLKTALGLLPLSSGEILYDGKNIQSLSPKQIAQKAAYLSQSRSVPNITAGRMVLHGRFPYLGYPRRYGPKDHEVVREALQKTESLGLKDRPMSELSGGQRQKVYLSMALAQQAQTVFMDEPTTYLDVRHQLETMQLARDLAASGTAVVMVLHDLSLALHFADQIVVLQKGCLVKTGTPDEVFESGVLKQVFEVQVRRILTESGWHYYYEV